MPQEQIQSQGLGNSQEDKEILRAKYGVIKMSLANDLEIGFFDWNTKYGKAFDEYAKNDLLLLDDYAELGTRDAALMRVKNAIYH